MRMIGQVMGARVTTATRRSVILSSDGIELLLTFWPAPSRSSSERRLAAPSPAAAAPSLLKKDRRPTRSRTALFMVASLGVSESARIIPSPTAPFATIASAASPGGLRRSAKSLAGDALGGGRGPRPAAGLFLMGRSVGRELGIGHEQGLVGRLVVVQGQLVLHLQEADVGGVLVAGPAVGERRVEDTHRDPRGDFALADDERVFARVVGRLEAQVADRRRGGQRVTFLARAAAVAAVVARGLRGRGGASARIWASSSSVTNFFGPCS